MKRLALIFIAFATLSGCSDEVRFNSPAFQGNKNYKLWRANYFDAQLSENGTLIIKAGDNIDKITIVLSSLQQGTYSLTETSESRIDFIDFDDINYSTSNPQDAKVNKYPEIGSITITKIEDNTITGNFRFFAFSADGKNSVGFNDGVIYKIPFK